VHEHAYDDKIFHTDQSSIKPKDEITIESGSKRRVQQEQERILIEANHQPKHVVSLVPLDFGKIKSFFKS